MGRMLVALLILLHAPSTVQADAILIETGKSATVSSSTSEGYNVWGGTLNILPGARIGGGAAASNGGTITMSGGDVVGGLTVEVGTIKVSGGSATGVGAQPGLFAGGTANILGGTFTGGSSPGRAGDGIQGPTWQIDGVRYLSTINIAG